MEVDAAGRTLKLLALLQARPTWPAQELADRTGTSLRTLRRDLRRLTGLGYVVQGKPGPGGHYRLAAGTRLPPLVFDDDEVVALVAGLRMAEAGGTAEAASRALAKLRRVLPRRLAVLAETVADHSEAVAVRDAPYADDVLGPLTAAAAAGRGVHFTYTDQRGATSTRQADSVRCLMVDGRWYVLAYDLGRQDWRVFRADRVRDITDGGSAVRRDPPAADLAGWLRSDFGRAGAPA